MNEHVYFLLSRIETLTNDFENNFFLLCFMSGYTTSTEQLLSRPMRVIEQGSWKIWPIYQMRTIYSPKVSLPKGVAPYGRCFIRVMAFLDTRSRFPSEGRVSSYSDHMIARQELSKFQNFTILLSNQNIRLWKDMIHITNSTPKNVYRNHQHQKGITDRSLVS
jgi:hypothetical protein